MQCGAKRSTCADCHGVSTTAPWHRDHAFADLCAACHQGHAEQKEGVEAHRDLVDPRTSCSSCHPASMTYASTYASTVVARAEPPAPVERHGRWTPNLAAVLVAVALGAALVRARRHS